MTPKTRLTELHGEMTEWRRDFHAHPEIGVEEHRTSAIVAGQLAEWGIDVHRGMGGTIVVGVLRGRREMPIFSLNSEAVIKSEEPFVDALGDLGFRGNITDLSPDVAATFLGPSPYA